MNRKERRAAEKRRDGAAKKQDAVADGTASLSIADLAAEAGRLRGMGRLDEAQQICRRILAREPAYVPALNLLGLIAQATGPVLSGALHDWTGNYTRSLECFAALSFLSILAALAARRPRLAPG